MSVPAIEARGLVRRFGGFLAVDGIDLVVQPGEVFGLLGANGAGKTTAIRMLCGLLPPSAGGIRIVGIDVVRRARRARSRIGYVAQRFALYRDLTVRENLVLQAGLYGLDQAQTGQRIDWALARLDLAASSAVRAAMIPLGLQRRLAVAAALLHRPAVLFLDEPTSGLDPRARSEFWELVYELAEAGAGVLVTTHYMDEALFCDRVALLHAGRVIVDSTPQALLAQATPVIEVDSPAIAGCRRLLAEDAAVIETVPYAGRLRARLTPGTDPVTASARVLAAATAAGVVIKRVAPVAADFEDIVVSLLERHGRGAK